jgi:hypothetical protein
MIFVLMSKAMFSRLSVFFSIFLLLNIGTVNGQRKSDVELSIQLLVPDVLGERILDTEPFFQWVKAVNEVFESELKLQSGNHEGMLLINLTKEKDSEFSLSFKPPLEDASRLRILEEVKKLPSYNTKFGEYTFFIRGILNKGSSRKGDSYYPPVVFPREQRIYEYGEMTLEEKVVFLKEWVDVQILPILAMFEQDVDSQFVGVKGMGDLLASGLYQNKNINSFIDTNYDYWRAILEMTKGNQLIPLSRICMHLSNEEWDIASNYLWVMDLFSKKNTLAEYYSQEIKDFLSMLKEHANTEIQDGIVLFDAGDLEGATLKYSVLHRIVPKLAFLNYEMYLTEVSYSKTKDSIDPERVETVWNRHKKNIYTSDPIYTSMAHAGSADEGFELVCRVMIKDLFKESGKTKRDLLRYADLAVELEDYAFAAHIYWWLFTYIGNDAYEGREMLNEFLYALHQLGDTQVSGNFKGDFKAEFKKIDERRQLTKESDSMYQSFAK